MSDATEAKSTSDNGVGIFIAAGLMTAGGGMAGGFGGLMFGFGLWFIILLAVDEITGKIKGPAE